MAALLRAKVALVGAQLLGHLVEKSHLQRNSFLRSSSILFLWDFGLSLLTSSHFILNHGAGFYKPTIPQYSPTHLKDYSTCNSARFRVSNIFLYPLLLIQMNGA